MKFQKWNLIVVIGAIIGGFIRASFLTTGMSLAINPNTITDLNEFGFINSVGTSYFSTELFKNDLFY